MASLTNSESTSVIACVNCARSKARCDRKVPCSRCVQKRLTCRPRLPKQRGTARQVQDDDVPSNFVPHLAPGLTIAPQVSQDSQPSQSSQPGLSSGRVLQGPTTFGAWMDWSHQFEAVGAVNEDQAPKKDAPVPVPSMPAASSTSGPENNLFALSPGAIATLAQDSGAFDDLDLLASEEEEEGSYASGTERIKGLEEWSLFKCNPPTVSPSLLPSSECQSILLDLLSQLQRSNSNGFNFSRLSLSATAIEPLHPSTREKLSSVLNSIWLEARCMETNCLDHPFLILPSSTEIEHLIRIYANVGGTYTNLVPFQAWNINQTIRDDPTILSCVRLFLVMAVGAIAFGGDRYPVIGRGLAAICRVSLLRLVEQNIQLRPSREVAECALLLAMTMIWGGDKMQMDNALYQRPMYLEMLLRSARIQPREEQIAQLRSIHEAKRWELWKEQELLNRTVYSWLVLDCEMALFRDAPSTSFLDIANLDLPIPAPDEAFSSTQPSKECLTPSLRDWTAALLADVRNPNNLQHVRPATLRLLLCYLIEQAAQLRARITLGFVGQGYLSLQINDARHHLVKWAALAQATESDDKDDKDPQNANWAVYHLALLNTMASVPEIEAVAATVGGPKERRQQLHHLAPDDVRDIFVHCGQVIRRLRAIPVATRPLWWPAAVYRVALIAWANSRAERQRRLQQQDHQQPQQQETNTSGNMALTKSVLLLDKLPEDDESITRYLNREGGEDWVAFFSCEDTSDSPNVAVEEPRGILRYFVAFLGTTSPKEENMSPLARGIQQKLAAMTCRWQDS